MDIYELEKVAIVILALIMAYAEFRQAIILKGSWIKCGLGVVGIYWAVYYGYSLYRTYFDLRLPSHQVFVRSGILITLAFVAAGAIRTLAILQRKK
jgi:hypothetical protein